MDQIVTRARQGETIKVTYRSKAAFIIQPDASASASPKPGSQAAMREYIKAIRALNKTPRVSSLNPNKPIKELYRELLDNDPKYNGQHR